MLSLVSCGSLPAYHWPTNAPTHACTHAHALRPGSSAAKLAMEEEESREKASGEAFQSWAAEKEKVMRGKKEKAKADEDRKRRKEEEKRREKHEKQKAEEEEAAKISKAAGSKRRHTGSSKLVKSRKGAGAPGKPCGRRAPHGANK